MKSNKLSPGAAAAKREYQAEYRKKNPTKAAEYLNRYWEKKAAAQLKAQS